MVAQCAADAREGDRCRADVARAYLRLEVSDATAADCVRRAQALEAELTAARALAAQAALKDERPSTARVFTYGAATGVVATLVTILVIALATD